MSEQHTATPWSYIVSKSLIHVETDMDNPTGAGIHICSMPKTKEANAAFIVEAVNSHEALKEQVRELVDCLRDGVSQGIHADGCDALIMRMRDCNCWLITAKALLAKHQKGS